MSAFWRNGLRLASPSGDTEFGIGGRVQLDATGFTVGPGPAAAPVDGGLNPPLTGAANLRRARLRAEGRFYEAYEWAT